MILRAAVLAVAAGAALGLPCAGHLPIAGTHGAYLIGAGGNLARGNVTLEHNSGFTLATTCEDGERSSPYSFTLFQLLGHTLSFTVDLSRVGCGCNLALYLVKGPARGLDGMPSLGQCSWNPYYCDASGVCGQWCPEMDIMEANSRAFSSTPHRCDAPSAKGHYTSCDQLGCSRTTNTAGRNAYGPGMAYRIDTTRPFDVLMTFHGNSLLTNPAAATFTGMETRLRQGDREVVLDFSECGGYFSSMAQAMAEGMSMRMTYWGGQASTMNWLDKELCGTTTCGGANAGEAMISNLKITSLCPREITIHGLEGNSYVKGFNGNVSGNHLLLKHNSGFSVTETCNDAWEPNHFKIFSLLGKTLSFTVDLSRVGCACNVALYLIRGPPRDWSGNPSVGSCSKSPYYCDANRVCGQWCPEVDVMEANNHVYQATPHRCDEPSNTGHYSNCDRKGCGQNTQSMGDYVYGPGTQYTINTRHPFTVHTTFHGSNLQAPPTFTGLTTKLQQDDRELVLGHSSCEGYLASLADVMAEGMSMRITYWGEDAKTMKWLDQPSCGKESCSGNNAGDAVISGIVVSSSTTNTSSGKPSAYPSHSPLASGKPAPPAEHALGPPQPPPAASGIPWWVYLFVWISVMQSCLLCVLGAVTVHLHQQISTPLTGPMSMAMSPPPSSRRPLTASPMNTQIHAIEPLPQFESRGSGSLMPSRGHHPVSPVRAHEV
mmetsp:Transcript_155299/g.377218  ORF Transcript_155299/g.377218 Transcript_155299/m.377218 type:complete len:714 (+) Transcript_155299:3-2144(+)